MENFEFQSGDADKLKELCNSARKAAKSHPCLTPIDVGDERFEFRFGSWFCRICVDAFKKPRTWHASASVLEVVGEQPQQLASGIIVNLPQEAMLATESWKPEHFKQARYLLGELFAPLIVGEKQVVHEQTGLFALHYITEYRGSNGSN